MLKGLGFLTADGTPTERYKQFLDGSRWKKVLAEAVREAYGDIFFIKAKPTNSDLQMIAGKFKSTYNLSDTAADRAARTFLALLNLSDHEALYGSENTPVATSPSLDATPPLQPESQFAAEKSVPSAAARSVGLHYSIQIYLPATKDVEVYNSIFKSLREHIID